MIDKCKKIELLAPAKDKECAFAAINAGADAVYIGAEAFGARKKAGNSIADISQIVDYAHKFLVKVYVTVNTIFYDKELDAVEKLIWELYEIGVDAIIFQDYSIFEMNLPPIALHASTQCNNDTLEKIKFLKELNIQRVVLPREFSIKQIKEITSNVNIETEVFVHGALCVSYSGQCYFSDFIGGRSANRGDCAQPCRRKYSLIDDNNKVILPYQHLLSMKDNNLSGYLQELVDADVTSLKIEGRLKDKDYVTNVVSFYRKEIDKLSKKLRPSAGSISTDFVPDINKTFNRGYTDFFIDGQRKCFINPLTPKYIGEYAGIVNSVKNNRLFLKEAKRFNAQDKIVYFNSNGELNGTTVTKTDGNSIEVLKKEGISTGTKIYRNFDSDFYKRLSTAKFIRKIPVIYDVFKDRIILTSSLGYSVSYKLDEDFEKADNIENSRNSVSKQLSKLGDTEFIVENIDISADFDLFMPVSKLNEIRRNLVLQLQRETKENYVFQTRSFPEIIPKYPVERLDYSYNISNSQAKYFYEKCGCVVKEPSPECKKIERQYSLMKTKHCLRDFAGICLKSNPDSRKLFLKDEFGNKFPLSFDCKNCVMYVKSPACK